MAFLIFILFILNIFLIFAVIILYTRQNKLVEFEKDQQKLKTESEEMLIGFLMELKEENEQFIKKVSEIQEQKQQGETVDYSNADNQEFQADEEQLKQQDVNIDTEAYS